MTTPSLSGHQFQISPGPRIQSDPAVTELSDGRSAVVWRDVNAAAINTIRLKIMNADGTSDGPDVVVSAPTSLLQTQPDIATLANGGFVVTYTLGTPNSIYNGPLGDGSNATVMAQRFDSNGNKLGAAFIVNSITAQSQFSPSISALADGGFAVLFETGGPVGPFFEEMGLRTFNADGTPRGPEVNFPWDGVTAQRNPTLTQLANGNLVMAWESADPGAPGIHDTNVFGITARILTAAGVPVTARFGVNTTTTGQQLAPDITALAGGGFVVTWTDSSGQSDDQSFEAVRAQVFNAAGAKLGGELLVNTTTHNGQIQPAILALSDGRFIIAWTDDSDFLSDDIRAQLFNADGTPSGRELVINTAKGAQQAPALTELSDGRVMVTWTDTNGQGGGDILGQAIDPREAAVNLSGTARQDILVGTRFGDDVNGRGGNDRLFGAAGADQLLGGAGGDQLDGGAGQDSLSGGDGRDRLNGGAGQDVLNGGTGADVFVFSSPTGTANADTVTGFNARFDRIAVDSAVFVGLAEGDLSGFAANAGGRALGGAAQIVYETDTGALWFDANGNAPGGRSRFATLSPQLDLTADHFSVF